MHHFRRNPMPEDRIETPPVSLLYLWFSAARRFQTGHEMNWLPRAMHLLRDERGLSR
jgi:hypothetical protein